MIYTKKPYVGRRKDLRTQLINGWIDRKVEDRKNAIEKEPTKEVRKEKRMERKDGITEDDCARCGKHFIVQPFHIYKIGEMNFCSNSCHCAELKEIELKKRNKKVRKNHA